MSCSDRWPCSGGCPGDTVQRPGTLPVGVPVDAAGVVDEEWHGCVLPAAAGVTDRGQHQREVVPVEARQIPVEQTAAGAERRRKRQDRALPAGLRAVASQPLGEVVEVDPNVIGSVV